ncbi:MAG: protein translocase subunit SecF [Deferribacterota bacterium]|nr:protein translocase subunit SecF [Deferribacterota bacterium]
MVKILKDSININFIGRVKLFYLFSGLLCIIGLVLIFFKGFNYGIDFAGGTLVQVKFEKKIDINELRKELSNIGFGDVVIQNFGSEKEILIRIATLKENLKEITDKLNSLLYKKYGKNNLTIERVEQVGPQIGAQLKKKALYAVIFALFGILVYISLRFEFIYSLSAVAALFHDVIITSLFLILTGREMNITVLAALLTVVGYSVNDTVVIFDRIRENIKNTKKKEAIGITINRGINETLSRTILTSGTTLLSLIALYIWGGAVINDFAFTLIIGILVGTYSSIGVASALVYTYKTKYA